MQSVRTLLAQRGGIFPRYLTGLDEEFRRQEHFVVLGRPMPCWTTSIRQYFREADWEDVLQAELLALPGWAGLMRRLEEDPSLAPHESVPCSLMDFLAVRLTMARVASRMGAAETVPQESPLKTQEKRRLSRAARIYDAARVVSLSADEVTRLSDAEWAAFVSEVKAATDWSAAASSIWPMSAGTNARFCAGWRAIGDTAGLSESQGQARGAGVLLHRRARGIHAARARRSGPGSGDVQLGRVLRRRRGLQGNRRPARRGLLPGGGEARSTRSLEQPKAEDSALLEKRRWRRRLLGLLMRQFVRLVAGRCCAAGSRPPRSDCFRRFPLIGHLLAPRRYAQLREWMNKAFLPEPRTELTLMRNTAQSQGAVTGLLTGFAAAEKTERVASVLGPAGLTRGFARLVVILGHGSTSLNNPHESAHDCGACGGRRGGPNARLFAAMANRPEVRERLRERGIDIPADTWFIGGYHDTCSDDVELYDLDALPATHQADLDRIRESLDKARARNAQERARRFESCPPRRFAGRRAAPCGRTQRAPGRAAARVRALHQCRLHRRAAQPDARTVPGPARVSGFL